MVGDQLSDIQFADKIGIKSFLFKKKNLYKFILNLPIYVKKD
jgi:histidinol phosphatase-like enzyme